MKILENTNLIRINGTFDMAALNPTWIKNNFPDIEVGEKIKLHFNGIVPITEVQFNLGDYRIILNPTTLIFQPIKFDKDVLDTILDNARIILRQFPHTMVGIMGINYRYETTVSKYKELFSHPEMTSRLNKHGYNNIVNLVYRLYYNKKPVNIMIVTDPKNENRLTINVNFHFDVKSTQDCLDFLNVDGIPNVLIKYLDQSHLLIEDIFKCEVKDV
ncbi:MAG: hypothetical protein U5N56_00250 [Candidatus Marinimicrobia bacterium]|nr:hypothetical protein [Candidatus Neomarinimicrobiota bacterium]